jgi:hypothetical protein
MNIYKTQAQEVITHLGIEEEVEVWTRAGVTQRGPGELGILEMPDTETGMNWIHNGTTADMDMM